MISGQPKQAEINCKTRVSVNNNNNNMEERVPKPKTLTFCTWKSCACPTRSLPVNCVQVVQLPARPNEKQSKASIIERAPTHALLRGRARMQAPTTRNYMRELPTSDPSAMKGPHLERTASLISVPPVSGKYENSWRGHRLNPNLPTSISLW